MRPAFSFFKDETSVEKKENAEGESDTDDEDFAKSKMTGRYLSVRIRILFN